MIHRLGATLVACAVPSLALAAPEQSALAPAGPQAALIYTLWLGTLALCGLVFVLVLGALLLAVARSRRGAAGAAPQVVGSPEPGLRRAVVLATAVSAILLAGLLVASVWTDRALARLPLAGALHIELTGHMWWWEAVYDDAEPARVFVTANELHVPVGRPVLVTLAADDVIHSLWVPSLQGKKDLIPGRTATLSLQADRPGVYRGQCAEFCGWQHAQMALLVVADPPDVYEQWAARQRAPAASPIDASARRGKGLFVGSTCAMCHAIAGTAAGGRKAPDLTHVASRATIGAGALANTAAARAAWVADAQRFKPGVRMPPHPWPAPDMGDLLAYLDTLR
jgi:cytochrome c oxidase subunit 2